MKAKLIKAAAMVSSVLLLAANSYPATIVVTGSGNWSSTAADAPWPGGVGPAATDNVTVNTPYILTVDTNATVDYIAGSGTVTMAPNSTLNVTGTTGGTGVAVATLNATATGNTVNYQGNTYFTAYTTYYNLIWSGYGAPYVTAPLTVLNDFTMSGSNGGQAGNGGLIVGHDLTVGPNCAWDISCSPIEGKRQTGYRFS